MSSLFKGASQAQHYAAARPTYPSALYDLILSKCKSTRGLCIDLGCGTGQATFALAKHFDSVVGIDPSPQQLEQAIPQGNITYKLGIMEEQLSNYSDGSVSCITSAQAVHWMDIPTLYTEVNRILAPGGVLALWTYGNVQFPSNPSLEAKVVHLYEDVLGDKYWDPRRRLVERLYRDIPLIESQYPDVFVSERVQNRPELDIRLDINKSQLMGYLRSWSGYTNYCRDSNIEMGSDEDPVQTIIGKDVDDKMTAQSLWPVALLLSVKRE